jgi:hypothetical protein
MELIKEYIWKFIYFLGHIRKLWTKKNKYKVLFRTTRKVKRENIRVVEDVIAKSFAKKYNF